MWLKSQERDVLGNVSQTDIPNKCGMVWTAARHRAECHPYLKKSKLVVSGWRFTYFEVLDYTL